VTPVVLDGKDVAIKVGKKARRHPPSHVVRPIRFHLVKSGGNSSENNLRRGPRQWKEVLLGKAAAVRSIEALLNILEANATHTYLPASSGAMKRRILAYRGENGESGRYTNKACYLIPELENIP